MALRRNVGRWDRRIRVGAGAVLLPLGLVLLFLGCPCGWVDIVIGAAGLFSGLSGFCVLYLPFGFSTARGEPRAEPRQG